MYTTRRNIHYIILEKTHTLVKFYNETNSKIFLKSILKSQIINHPGSFYMVKTNKVSNDEFDRYIKSLSKYCCVTDRRGNRVTLQVNDPF